SIEIVVEIRKIWTGFDASLEEIAKSKNKLTEIGAKLDSSINSMIVNMEKESIRRADNIFYTTLTLLTFSIFLGIFFMYFISRVILQPFSKIISELDSVSKGDLTKEIDVKIKFWGFTFNDEIAHLVDSVNTIIRNLRVSIGGIHRTSQDMSDVSRGLKGTSEGIKESAQTQFGAMKEASLSVDESNASIGTVVENTEELLKAAESASASSIEMSAAVISVAEHVERLAESVHITSASISQIGASLQQVAAHVNTLFSATEEAASYATEINYIVKDVGNSSREQAHLAEQVKRDASTIGVEAMDRTMSGMEKIKEEVVVTSAVIKRLAERSNEIGKIIEVIDEIADTTNLLSLNAAILAAQAGEHGLGFA
ncbi:MAG: methyl-accepting chemotaxis protein, partial [Deltaproteobacteria bacterium]